MSKYDYVAHAALRQLAYPAFTLPECVGRMVWRRRPNWPIWKSPQDALVTLIHPEWIVTAGHWPVPDGRVAQAFFKGADGLGLRQVLRGWRPVGWTAAKEVWIGRLDAPVHGVAPAMLSDQRRHPLGNLTEYLIHKHGMKGPMDTARPRDYHAIAGDSGGPVFDSGKMVGMVQTGGRPPGISDMAAYRQAIANVLWNVAGHTLEPPPEPAHRSESKAAATDPSFRGSGV